MNLHPRIDNICNKLHTMYDASIIGDLEPFEVLLARIETNLDHCTQYQED